ncbi:MAG: hypothetical protein AVDCRST_MAG19-3436, partial [uncultured Thermomicrobiales bacterium]
GSNAHQRCRRPLGCRSRRAPRRRGAGQRPATHPAGEPAWIAPVPCFRRSRSKPPSSGNPGKARPRRTGL